MKSQQSRQSGLSAAAQGIMDRLSSMGDRQEGEDAIADESAGYILESKRHPAAFRDHLLRCHGGVNVRIGRHLDDWQRADFEAMDDAWLYATGLSNKRPVKRRAYLERARGHSKTSDQALMAVWAVLAAPSRITGTCCAAKEEQAEQIMQAAEMLMQDNCWLADVVAIRKGEILNPKTGSSCKVMPAKANTSFGKRLDFALCDELTHWNFQEVWTAIFSGLYKVPSSVLIVISNAGYGKGRSWQWNLREKFREDPAWYFHALPSQQASWLNEEDIQEQQRILEPDEFKRLILNHWLSDTKGGILFSDLKKVTTLQGPARGTEHGCEAIIGGLDVGIKNDRTSLVWLGIETQSKKLKLLRHRTWSPKDFASGQVELRAVEAAILEDHKALGGVSALYADDWQAIATLQRLTEHFRCFEVPFSTKKVRTDMAKLFVDSFQSGWIELYPDEILESDILSIEVKTHEESHTKVLRASRDENGHADSAFALAIAVMNAWEWMQVMSSPGWVTGGPQETVRTPVFLY